MLIFSPQSHLPRKASWCKNNENRSDRESHTLAPLTLILAARAGKNFQTCKDSQKSKSNNKKLEKYVILA
jgi:hypothetical protein